MKLAGNHLEEHALNAAQPARTARRQAFTLVEMIVVLGIIGILAALAAVIKPQFGILIPIVALLAFTRARATRDPWLPVVTGLAGAAVIALVALPFGITLIARGTSWNAPSYWSKKIYVRVY